LRDIGLFHRVSLAVAVMQIRADVLLRLGAAVVVRDHEKHEREAWTIRGSRTICVLVTSGTNSQTVFKGEDSVMSDIRFRCPDWLVYNLNLLQGRAASRTAPGVSSPPETRPWGRS
jgi:hypothetical protein